MQQYYRNAQFIVRARDAVEAEAPWDGYADISDPSALSLCTTMNGIEIDIPHTSSALLDLLRARRLLVERLYVRFAVNRGRGRDCESCGQSRCDLSLRDCKTPNIDVSIAFDNPCPASSFHSTQNNEGLLGLLNDPNSAVQEPELQINAVAPRLKQLATRAVAWNAVLAETPDALPNIEYDWTFFEGLPKKLRRIRVGVFAVNYTPHITKYGCRVAQADVRERCQEAVTVLIGASCEVRKSKVYVSNAPSVDDSGQFSREHKEFGSRAARSNIMAAWWEAPRPMCGSSA